MKRYHIRFNTKHADTGLVWRVFENGKEYLFKHISIEVPVRDEITIEDGVVKWNIACDGTLIYDGNNLGRIINSCDTSI